MGKESMGEFLESAVASVLRFKHNWQTVIENYHLLRPSDIKKKHEPKVSSIEIDVFGFGALKKSSSSEILAPRNENEIIIIQCKDEWYEHEHRIAVNNLKKAEEIVKIHYPEHPIRKVVVTLLLKPTALANNFMIDNDVHFICNLSHLKQRIEGSKKYRYLRTSFDSHLEEGRIGDLRCEIITPLLGKIRENLKGKNQTSLTNFPSIALQALRFLINLTYFSDNIYPPFISDEFWKMR
jgi:hypothetical protein